MLDSCFCRGTVVFDTVVLAPTKSDFLTFRGLCHVIQWFQGEGVGCFSFDPLVLIATGVSDQFLLHFKAFFIWGLPWLSPTLSMKYGVL